MKKELDAEKRIVDAGYVWSMNTNLGDGKMIQVTGNFDKGASPLEMSKEIDKVSKALQIQRLKQLEIPTTTRELENQAQAADVMQDDLDRLVEQHKGLARVPQQTKALMDNTRENVRKFGERIQAGKEHLDRLVAQLKELESE